jgi:hypothetical protein
MGLELIETKIMQLKALNQDDLSQLWPFNRTNPPPNT